MINVSSKKPTIRVQIDNFKSIRSAAFELKSGLNILIGPNGSGKTCILSALKFIRDLLAHGVGLAIAKGGGARRNYHRDSENISFAIEFDYGGRLFERHLVPFRCLWEITISQRGKEQIATIIAERVSILAVSGSTRAEVLCASVDRANVAKPKFHVFVDKKRRFGRDLFRSPNLPGKRTKQEIGAHGRKYLANAVREVKPNNDHAFFPHLVRLDDRFLEALQLFLNLNEYNILPDVARQPADQLPIVEMRPDGRNLSEVIYSLEQQNYHRLSSESLYYDNSPFAPRSHWRWNAMIHGYRSGRPLYWRGSVDLTNALSNINRDLSAAVSPIDEVSVLMDPTSGKRFVVFRAGKHTFYPEEVSDGTMKWLCILVSIYVPFSRVYLLEEPENFLHPWMQQKLIRIMRQQAARSHTMFILTSHSATILNASDVDEILLVQAGESGTRVNAVGSKEEIRRVLSESNFGLGDLWVSGAIGGVPANG